MRVGSVLLPVAAENAGARTATAPGDGGRLPINQNPLKFREKRGKTTTGRSTAVDAVINWTLIRCEVRSCGRPAELVDIKALLGHESIATTQIYTNVGQARMEKVVGRL